MTPVRVKMCGITRLEDARAAVDAGASAIGLVFWPGSPRYISLERGAAIAAAIPRPVMKIGVFVDQPRALVETAVRDVGLDGIQLHGRENPADYDVGVLLLKSVPVGAGFDRSAVARLQPHVLALLDAADEALKGGTGTRVNWLAAADAAATRPVVLAGGLTPENVREAIRVVRPYAVDVSSGIETAPGQKHADRIRAFLAAVQAEAGDIPRGYWS